MTSTHAELESLVRRLVASWNERDEEGFAALFEPSAEYVTGEGERRWLIETLQNDEDA